ncbi:AzlC family ABC transporter permease [Roseibium sp. HPY-6]|uniref:AzlC family ABC transporter permease n=1 Tax=Roseibium sp. HPY-6 TaxID=3229852 RepID=UPI00338EB569
MRRLLPVSLFVVPFGIAYGVAATEQGLGPFQTIAMSALVFTATAQFAALDFLEEPIAYLSLGLVVLALSGRHIIMSAALSKWINQLPVKRRLATLAFLSDANFADFHTSLQREKTDLGVLFGGGVTLWLAWVGSTATGAFGGDLFGETDHLGFDVVMICFFAATVFGAVRRSQTLFLPVLSAMAVSALTYPYMPTGWNIILAAFVGGAVAVMLHAE